MPRIDRAGFVHGLGRKDVDRGIIRVRQTIALRIVTDPMFC